MKLFVQKLIYFAHYQINLSQFFEFSTYKLVSIILSKKLDFLIRLLGEGVRTGLGYLVLFCSIATLNDCVWGLTIIKLVVIFLELCACFPVYELVSLNFSKMLLSTSVLVIFFGSPPQVFNYRNQNNCSVFRQITKEDKNFWSICRLIGLQGQEYFQGVKIKFKCIIPKNGQRLPRSRLHWRRSF